MKRFLFDRRGSSTIEYVMILAVGAILAMILTVTMGSEEIQSDRKE
ncbi:Flp pilus assembly pilin Flp [Kroppenstedtia sanguinis]|uniref:Flp family type IVb pilin n=1 Tax=Kroppenstedtia sanguinis TaxID=1380684 RepID=A0ABW4C6B7_9BACL